MTYVQIEVVDTGSEYGFFGKVVARSDIRGMTDQEIVSESEALLDLFGSDSVYQLRYVEEVLAA